MTFAQPIWLYGLLLIPVLAALVSYNDHRNRKRLERLVASRLIPDLTDAAPRTQKILKRFLFLGALSAFLLALARPQAGFTEQEFTRRGRDIMLAIDTSKSMLSTDIAPDRLTRAKLAAQDLLNMMKGDRFGLIAFAGASQVEAPLTVDYQTVVEAINQLDTKTVERGGTDISASIYSAELALGKSDQSYRSLVLFTDGEDLDEDSIAAAREAAASGIRIFTVGIGTKQGSLIPIGPDNQQYLRDKNGQLVRSRLDENRLRQIAHDTGGMYLHLDEEGISRLVSDGLRNVNQGNIGGGAWRIPIERYRWPLAAGLLLLLLASAVGSRERKRLTQNLSAKTTAAVALLFVSTQLKGASSLGRYDQGDFEGALQGLRDELKSDPNSPVLNFNAGDAAYRLQKFEEAFEAYSKAMMSEDSTVRQKAYYNAGNALFMEGNLAEEIEQQLSTYYDARYQYHQALDLNPRDEQAKKNLGLLEERIKEVEKQKQEATQQNQRPRRQRKQRNQNTRQKDQKGQRPNQQDDSEKQEDDQEMPPDQSQQSDSAEGDDQNGPAEGPSPTPKKNGEVREIAPSDQQPHGSPAPSDEKRGQMSEEEALSLLDSMKDEGDKIDLLRRKVDRGVSRDW
jgi:Ca-activated chloride channel family protein